MSCLLGTGRTGLRTVALRSPRLMPVAHLGTQPLHTRPAAWTAPVRSSCVPPSGRRLPATLLRLGHAACRRPRHRPRHRPPATQAFSTTSPSSCSSASLALLPSASFSPSPSQPHPRPLSRPHLRPSGIRLRRRHPHPRRHRHPHPRPKLPRPRLTGGSHSRRRSSREMTAALVTKKRGGLQMLHRRGGGSRRARAHAARPAGPAMRRPATWATSSSAGSRAPRSLCRASA